MTPLYHKIMRAISMGVKAFFFAGILALLLHYFILQPYVVPDNTMTPAFHKGDILLVNRLPYFLDQFTRGEIIVFRDSNKYSQKYIRRILGLPEERVIINDGILKINGEIRELALFDSVFSSVKDEGNLDAHEYYVVPDAEVEYPIGILDKRFIVGKPLLKIWPIQSIKVYK